MIPIFNTREQERELLIEELFWQPYAGRNVEYNILFKICRNLKSEYCQSFNENGYTDRFVGFDPKKVTEEVRRNLTDDDLILYVGKFNENIAAVWLQWRKLSPDDLRMGTIP